MRKKVAATLLSFLLILGISLSVYGMSSEQYTAIQSFVEEAQRVSRAPGISVAVVAGGETHFFSAGVANRETGISANEDTLYELASVTKAFTSFGVLYLEERGLLSLDDSIADHLPWLTFRYNGQPVDMQNVRLYHFMHHTSGLSMVANSDADSLKRGLEAVVDAELSFYPGERYQYSNENTIILGFVIETVSGQNLESFMEQRIFHPLGMMDTFAYRENAVATGRFAQGYITQFIFLTLQGNISETMVRNNLATGHIVSSTRDMARWMEIQLGLVTDIPEIFLAIIPRSHEVGQSVVEPCGSYYAAGWIVNEEQGFIQHSGSNSRSGFGSDVYLFPEEQIGITVLTNLSGPHIITGNATPVNNIKDILDGNLNQSYSMLWTFQHLDVTFTITTVLGLMLAVLFFLLGLRRRKQNERHSLTKKRIALVALWLVAALIMAVQPMLFSWMIQPIHSFLTMGIALALMFGSFAWFVSFPVSGVSRTPPPTI